MQIIKAKLDKSSGISRIRLENITYLETEFIPYFNSGSILNQICNYLINKEMVVDSYTKDDQGEFTLYVSYL